MFALAILLAGGALGLTPAATATGGGLACPGFGGEPCTVCIAHVDGRCPGRWCNQPCVHTSVPVGGHSKADCMPANWFAASKPAGVTCTGNATGCSRSCSPTPGPPTPPTPPPSPPHPPPPSPPSPPHPPIPVGPCKSNLGCSLNGVCGTGGVCACDPPWTGPACGLLQFAESSPTQGRDLYSASDTQHNTWNGPMLVDEATGDYHMYVPLYPAGLLYHPVSLLHGTAPTRDGPWAWTNASDVIVSINPGALQYTDAAGVTHYTLWVSKPDGGTLGAVYTSSSPAGPWVEVPNSNATGCYINPSPLYTNGTFYCTGQKGTVIMAAKSISGPWTQHASIMDSIPTHHGEDPFLWVDARGGWHALFHTSGPGSTHCANTSVATHIFSADGGRVWSTLAAPFDQPYKPVVKWDDVAVPQAYATMERPHLYFDKAGGMTHLGVAAPLNIGDGGCPNAGPACKSHGRTCSCASCKYVSHAGTLLISLG